MRLGVDLRTNAKKFIMCLKEIELRAENMLTIPGSIVNVIGGSV